MTLFCLFFQSEDCEEKQGYGLKFARNLIQAVRISGGFRKPKVSANEVICIVFFILNTFQIILSVHLQFLLHVSVFIRLRLHLITVMYMLWLLRMMIHRTLRGLIFHIYQMFSLAIR